MMKIYAIATQTDECYGHGDYGKEWVIGQLCAYHQEGIWNPVFTKEEDAQKFLDEIKFNYNKKIVELELLEKLQEKGE